MILNFWGALVREYNWWNWPNVRLIIIIGYSLYKIFSFWIHDMGSMKRKVAFVTAMYAIDVVCLVVFMGVLRWI